MTEGGAYKAYNSESEAIPAWAKVVSPIAGKYEIGALISSVDGQYYLGGAFSNGSIDNVTGLLEYGGYVAGGKVTAFTHTHPVNVSFSGYDAAYNYGSLERTWTKYNYDIEGDLTTAYGAQVNAYVAMPSHLDSWNYAGYVSAQRASMAPVNVGSVVKREW